MSKTLQNQLQRLGLNEKEAEIYLTLLQLGPSSVLEISRHCDVKRATIYNVLEALTHKGLVSLEIDGLKNHYRAEPPHALENLIKQQQFTLESCMPELKKLETTHEDKNFIKTYTGQESIHRAYDYLIESLTPSSAYLVIGDAQNWYDSDPEYFDNWVDRRRKIIRHGRSIFNDSPKAQEFHQLQKNLDTSVKIMPGSNPISAIKVITSKLVFIHKTGTPSTVIIIENPSIVELYQEMFDAFWNLL